MQQGRRKLPSPATAIALLALVVAVAGTALAGPNATTSALNKPEKKQTRSLARQEIAKAAPSLSVASAANAAAVGGTPLEGLLRTNACQRGKVLGFARIRGFSGTVPSTYTSAPTAVDIVENCSGGTVEVRRTGPGQYMIRFNGNAAFFAFVQVRFDSASGTRGDNCATVTKDAGGGDVGAFQVWTFDCSTDTYEDTDVTVLLP